MQDACEGGWFGKPRLRVAQKASHLEGDRRHPGNDKKRYESFSNVAKSLVGAWHIA